MVPGGVKFMEMESRRVVARGWERGAGTEPQFGKRKTLRRWAARTAM